MVAFAALPALLILLTLVSVPLRVFPVRVGGASAGDEAKACNVPAIGVAATMAPNGPCQPRSRILEVARRAAGPEYRADTTPRMQVDGDTCSVLLWRLPKKPGGYRIVTVDAHGRVVSVRPGL
jgi:hypothetical protein